MLGVRECWPSQTSSSDKEEGFLGSGRGHFCRLSETGIRRSRGIARKNGGVSEIVVGPDKWFDHYYERDIENLVSPFKKDPW